MTSTSRWVPIGLAAALVAGNANAAPLRFVQVNSVRGRVQRLTRKTKGCRAVKVGDKLFRLDLLRTGKESRTVLRLDGSDSTLVFVGPNTLLQVCALSHIRDGARRSKFFVKRGEVRSRVRKLRNANSRVEFQTPACMGGVRGTELAVAGSQKG